MFVLFLPCLSRYDVHDDDDHDDNGVTLSWYPSVMKQWKTKRTSLSRQVERIHTEPKRIHNSAQQQERRDDDSDSCFHDSVVVDCFTFYADGYFYHIRFLPAPFGALLCL